MYNQIHRIFFFEKMRTFLHFFNKNIGIFEKLTSENLTKCQLTTPLVLNNRTQVCFRVCGLGLPSDSCDVAFYDKFGIDATWWRWCVMFDGMWHLCMYDRY